ncbi:hypothetical protein [Cellulomonas oligotrophica]|uniref:Uncharacterized protein n=1 Tax=Cellulomonas oligotrophica TaxID=931536 RepID=A0A7Y9FHI4_9CELL|nr:hypothetical protein [Cellulomonas oligotrophica]NYD87344.1 hypothetical protein [Cellulomonas oligotrophica]GIG34263.1 hypothetical protein Col01nite_34220 [Cellulomonas oligotrophica]
MSSSTDHSLFRRRELSPGDVARIECDLFLSAYNDSERVRTVYSSVRAARKVWLLHEEYGYSNSDLPPEECFAPMAVSEAEWWIRLVADYLRNDLVAGSRVVIDITGMMRPHIMIMPLIMRQLGVDLLTVLYTDPTSYMSGSRTSFASGSMLGVRQVEGLEGAHVSAEPSDVLVIGAGYDHELVRAVAEAKRSCQHLVLLGLPSLQPHMYQESQARLAQATESLNRFADRSLIFAPADDPFATATVLQQKMAEFERRNPRGNFYFCPVGSKAQVLGFSWYFLTERRNGPASMLFPFKPRYSRETSVGFSRAHQYDLELGCLLDEDLAEA